MVESVTCCEAESEQVDETRFFRRPAIFFDGQPSALMTPDE